MNFYQLPINPPLERKDLDIKYAADSGGGRTVGDMAADIVAMLDRDETTSEEFREYLDREFFYGAWKHIVERLPNDGILFLKNISGLIRAVHRARARQLEGNSEKI